MGNINKGITSHGYSAFEEAVSRGEHRREMADEEREIAIVGLALNLKAWVHSQKAAFLKDETAFDLATQILEEIGEI